jgi:nucleoside-diphosphate-sugar epimerase
MNNLVIGNTSQLSYYFPRDYKKISSRNINYNEIKKNKYDRIFLLFAEQRTFLNKNIDFFTQINVDYTLEVIENLKEICNNIVVYSTSELWNKYDGCISIENKYDYNETPYIKSKEILCSIINSDRKKYKNVIIVYPFNFNSVYRKEGFLFGKIFDSLLNNKKITIGDVDFERDLIHPKFIVDKSIQTNCDVIVGSGELINVKKFIIDLFKLYYKKFDDYIVINKENNLKNKRNNYFSCIKNSTYEELLKETIKDLYEYKIS